VHRCLVAPNGNGGNCPKFITTEFDQFLILIHTVDRALAGEGTCNSKFEKLWVPTLFVKERLLGHMWERALRAIACVVRSLPRFGIIQARRYLQFHGYTYVKAL
jgi:hypothetical protein